MNLTQRSSVSAAKALIGVAALLLALGAAACDVPPGADADRNEAAVETTTQSLVSGGGGGGGTNFWCDDDGGCSCLGGSLSQDCWLLSQYCVDRFVCSPYPPYRCDCHWKLVAPTQPPRVRVPLAGATLAR